MGGWRKTSSSATVTGGGGGSGSQTFQSHALTTSTTNIVPTNTTPAVGDITVVRLTQDATGGRLVTWDVKFKYASGYTLFPDPNTVTVYSFMADGASGNWILMGQPVTGV